jgi:hypothetical protein
MAVETALTLMTEGGHAARLYAADHCFRFWPTLTQAISFKCDGCRNVIRLCALAWPTPDSGADHPTGRKCASVLIEPLPHDTSDVVVGPEYAEFTQPKASCRMPCDSQSFRLDTEFIRTYIASSLGLNLFQRCADISENICQSREIMPLAHRECWLMCSERRGH